MEKLALITLLEKEIEQEITRLEQTCDFDLEKEQRRFRIYEQLTKEILETHVQKEKIRRLLLLLQKFL